MLATALGVLLLSMRWISSTVTVGAGSFIMGYFFVATVRGSVLIKDKTVSQNGFVPVRLATVCGAHMPISLVVGIYLPHYSMYVVLKLR